MRTTCPFCGRKFESDPRSLIADPFCNKCIEDRIKASGGKIGVTRIVQTVSKNGYVTFQDQR
ncbi:hypothetical protein LOY85_16110 [Brevibacillus brevis]|uniref:hypothetical protein n=1 Tax=Brevibacillus brevis TaxID=1393 RepID=UPI001F24C80B|nr:hypothetical protein [Brevibacillus brevis]UIO40334.1 hypothetical protein LOY85_16110 [Brevibacillus brevis]